MPLTFAPSRPDPSQPAEAELAFAAENATKRQERSLVSRFRPANVPKTAAGSSQQSDAGAVPGTVM